MAIEYEYNKREGYVLVSPKGRISLSDVMDYIDRVIKDDSICEPYMELVDFTQVREFKFGYHQSQAIWSSVLKLKEAKSYLGSCFVVDNDTAKGMSSQLRVMAKEFGISVTTFNSVEDAIQYIEVIHD